MSARRTVVGLVVLAVGLADLARAHWTSPEEILARLNSAEAHAASGIERATRDPQVPRLLVIRVSARWYGRDAAARRAEADGWFALWRASVSQGIVAVLDAGSDAPVVQFHRGEAVSVSGPPPAAGGAAAPQAAGTMPRPAR